MSGPTHSFEEQDLLAHVRTALELELPVSEGPYTLSTRPLPKGERAPWDGQVGPVLHDSTSVHVSLHFDGLTRQGDPDSTTTVVRICARSERDHARVTAMIQAFARTAHRAMRDAQDNRFGEPPWFGLVLLTGAMERLVDAPARSARTLEQCEAILLTSRELQEILTPPADQLDAAVAALDAWVAAHKTVVRTQTFMLEIVHEPHWSQESRQSPHGVEVKRGGLILTLRMLVFEEDGSIRDIKEQQLHMVPASSFGEMDRVLACLDGWVAVLPRFVAKITEFDTLMPHDFVEMGVLDQKKPRTAEDFETAFARKWKLL